MSFAIRLILLSLTFLLLSAGTLLAAGDTEAPQTGQGTVLETMDAAGYTYILVDDGLSPHWVAIPQTQVAPGDKVIYLRGMVMNDFHSKTLEKTFEAVVFSPGLVEESSPNQAPAGSGVDSGDSFAAAVQAEQQATATLPVQPMEASGGSLGAVMPFAEVQVEKATGDNAYNVGEIFAQAKKLTEKKVRVRGKVMKFSRQIMGRNWVHLQDGTGDPMKNSHDLVVTTKAELATGQVVTLEGILAADKDFGAGYRYEVIVESASLISE